MHGVLSDLCPLCCSIVAVAAAQALLMGGAEFARLKAPADMDPLYPGGKAFDPLGFTTDPESFAELKVRQHAVLSGLS